MRAIESVAQRLGNTPSICRKCYIHPAILDSYMNGTMLEGFKRRAEEELKASSVRTLKPEEAAVLAFLQKRLAEERKNSRSTLVEKLEASIAHRKKRKRA